MPASTLSHHLKRLVDTGLVRQERAGTSLICHAEYPAMQELLSFLADECCADEREDYSGETSGTASPDSAA